MTAPGVVGIVEETGGISYVREADLATAKAEGARVATQDEIDRHNYQGGLAGAASTADALARGATFGASDKLQVEAARLIGGDEAASQMAAKTNLLKEGFSDTTGLAEVAGGFLIPVPGAGAAKGVAGAVGKGLAGVAERAGMRGLAGVAEHVLPGALTAGYEGAVMGAGQALSESALGDHDLTAEKLFSHAGKGGLLGFGIGAALHAPVAALARRGEGAAGGALERVAEREGAGPYRSLGVRAEEAAVGVAEREAVPAGGILSKIQGMADEESFRSLGGLSKNYKLLGRTAEAQMERAQGIGKLLRDEGIVTPLATKAEMAEKIAAKVEETGRELGAMRKALDETGVKVSTAPILERAQAEVLAPLEAKLGFKGEAAQIRGYLAELSEMAGSETTFEKLHQMRRNIGEKAQFDKVTSPVFANELKRLNAIVEDEFTKAGEKASALKGEAFTESYKTAKLKYSMLKDAESAVKVGLDRKGVNRTVSLTDTIMGAGAFATMGPVGLLAAGANKAMREFGSQTAAVMLDKVTKLEAVQRAASAVDAQMGHAVQSIRGGKVAGRGMQRVSSAQAESVAKSVLANPEALAARVQAFVGGGLREVAPRVADAASSVATRAAVHLQQTAPKPLPPVNRLQPQREKAVYSPTDVARYAKRIEAIQDPTILARGVATGQVSREHVEAVKAVYPRLFAVMQGRLLEEVAKLPKELPYQTRVALSTLFEVPLDASMSPQMVTGLQAQYRAAPSKGGTPPPRPLNPATFRQGAPASARIEGPPGR